MFFSLDLQMSANRDTCRCQNTARCTVDLCPAALTLSMSDICCVIQPTPEVPGRPATSTRCPSGCFSASSLNATHLQQRCSWAWQQALTQSALLWQSSGVR